LEVKDRTGLHMDLRDAAASSKYRREAGDQADSAAQYARQAQSSARQAEDCLDAAAEAVSHYPRIGGEYWQVWDAERGEYVSTGIMAQGPRGEIGPRGDPGPGPNRCIVDNWYFIGGGSQLGDGIFPINQRRQQSYELGSGQYGIDRWSASGTGLTESLQSDGVIFGVENVNFNRWFRNGFSQLPPGTYTASILVTEIETETYVSFGIGRRTSSFVEVVRISEPGLYHITARSAEVNSLLLSFPAGGAATIKVAAIKLEPGDVQTLAHQEGGEWALNDLPDFGAELLRCQRYFQMFCTEALRPSYAMDCRPVMAGEPTRGTLTLADVTYYTLSV